MNRDPRDGVHPGNRCPRCDAKLEAASSLDDAPAPKPGDLSVCSYCGRVLVFERGGRLRSATDAELLTLDHVERMELARVLAATLRLRFGGARRAGGLQ